MVESNQQPFEAVDGDEDDANSSRLLLWTQPANEYDKLNESSDTRNDTDKARYKKPCLLVSSVLEELGDPVADNLGRLLHLLRRRRRERHAEEPVPVFRDGEVFLGLSKARRCVTWPERARREHGARSDEDVVFGKVFPQGAEEVGRRLRVVFRVRGEVDPEPDCRYQRTSVQQ